MQKSVHTSEYAAVLAELRKIREAAGLSQRALALLLDVPHSWVAKVETGERRLDLLEFQRFAAACRADSVAAFKHVVEALPKSRTPRPARGKRL